MSAVDLSTAVIGFIGCGKMAQAMIKGFLKAGIVTADRLVASASNPNSANLATCKVSETALVSQRRFGASKIENMDCKKQNRKEMERERDGGGGVLRRRGKHVFVLSSDWSTGATPPSLSAHPTPTPTTDTK